MRKFILRYWLGTALLFSIFYWESSPFSSINYIQTNLTVFLTSLILPSELMSGHEILISSNYMLVIEKACNGIVPYLFVLASILAFPSSNEHKIKWLVIGYIVIVSINTFRIWLITKFVLHTQSSFSLAHDYIGNILLIATSLVIFVIFVKNIPKRVVI
jgi:exosortase/archaeosortase family protein